MDLLISFFNVFIYLFKWDLGSGIGCDDFYKGKLRKEGKKKGKMINPTTITKGDSS